jgi:hypothetical protein
MSRHTTYVCFVCHVFELNLRKFSKIGTGAKLCGQLKFQHYQSIRIHILFYVLKRQLHFPCY